MHEFDVMSRADKDESSCDDVLPFFILVILLRLDNIPQQVEKSGVLLVGPYTDGMEREVRAYASVGVKTNEL